jgi:hypothetical protein
MTSIYIDGDIFVTEDGKVVRMASGNTDRWAAGDPGDTLLREAPRYTLIASAGERRAGVLYAYDAANGRVLAFDKATGTFIEQYRLAGGQSGWDSLRAMYVVPDPEDDGPPSLYWIGRNALHRALLAPIEDGTGSSPGPSGGSGSSPAPSGTSAAP